MKVLLILLVSFSVFAQSEYENHDDSRSAIVAHLAESGAGQAIIEEFNQCKDIGKPFAAATACERYSSHEKMRSFSDQSAEGIESFSACASGNLNSEQLSGCRMHFACSDSTEVSQNGEGESPAPSNALGDINQGTLDGACRGSISSKGGNQEVAQFLNTFIESGGEIPEEVKELVRRDSIVEETRDYLKKPGMISGDLPEINTFDDLVNFCSSSAPTTQGRYEIRSNIEQRVRGEGNLSENPFRIYESGSYCYEVMTKTFFTKQKEAPVANLRSEVCRDVASLYSAESGKQPSEADANKANFQPFREYFGSEIVVRVDDQDSEEVRYNAGAKSLNPVKTFYALLSPCVGLRNVVEAVSAEHDEDNQPGLRGELCITRYNNDDDEPKSALDYGACKNALNFMAADDLGNMAGGIGTNIYSTISNVQDQQDAQNQAMQIGDNPNDTAANRMDAQFQQQQDRFKTERNSHYVKAGLRGTTGTLMLQQVIRYPTPNKSSTDYCINGDTPDGGLEDLNKVLFCSVAMMAESDQGTKKRLWPNQDMRDLVAQRAGGAITDSLVNGLMAYIKNKNANSVQTVQDTLANAEFRKPENQLQINNDMCSVTPNAPSCQGLTGGRIPTSGGMDFQFSGGPQNQGGNVAFDGDGLDGEFDENDPSARPSDEVIDDISNIAGGTSDNKFDDDFRAPGAAGMTAGGRGGGGGGGAGAGGGGGVAGGGGPAKAGQKGGAQKDFGKKLKGNYTTSGNGIAYRTSGSSKKKGDKKDPFAALRKKGKRGPSSVVDKTIMPKTSKLFETISKRYSWASKQGIIQK